MSPTQTEHPPPRMNVIGCGRAAGSLVRLWLEAGAVTIGRVMNRSRRSSEAAIARIGQGRSESRLQDMPAADCWLIGVGDGEIAAVARSLAGARNDLAGRLVFHLAGRFGPVVLSPLAERHALTAALHPVRSLTHAALTVSEFAGTACVAEGSDQSLAALEPLVRAVQGLWLPVKDIDRGLYHAAVAVVSNVTKGVAWKAQNWLAHAGLPEETGAAVTHQLLQSTVEDLFRAGARQSITGPIVRGDTSTIAAHLAALRGFPEHDVEVYRVLVRTVLELAQDRGDLDEDTLMRFQALLAG